MISRSVSVVWQDHSNQQKPAKTNLHFSGGSASYFCTKYSTNTREGPRIEDSSLGDECDPSGYSLLI